MPPLADVTTIDDVAVTARIQEGKLEMESQADTKLHIKAPDYTPLSTSEPHATLFASDEDTRVELTLDGEGLDALVDAISHIRDGGDA
ncbi:hypothetical protein [Halorhabdus amylolytica]|uniref:hypothetical protein n=1 Tax=Halorhabdus amylolytica TaxID=2559573 RepID=UPI0010AAC917|nr:hypothetical protein [Halorhabdus amylolytica]